MSASTLTLYHPILTSVRETTSGIPESRHRDEKGLW